MNSNNDILQKVIDETEVIFKSIAENYPVLLTELEASIDNAVERIRRLETHDGKESLNDYLLSCRNISRENLIKLDSFKRDNEKILKSLTGSINEYRKSQTYIDEIRNISENLKIVSLNALCNAVKAGKGGEGFSVITENLKEVTEDTISRTESLENKNDMVKQSLELFYGSEDDISSTRRVILSMLEEKVLTGIEEFQKQSGIAGKLLNELAVESEGIRKNIVVIMQELQQQDLIRQTIDQIILSINELTAEYTGCGEIPEITEENLDEAIFSIRIIELSVSMIDEVVGNLENTINVFTENFRSARTKLEYIQKEKDRAVDDFFKSLESFRNLSRIGKDISSETETFSSKRIDLILLISKLIGSVRAIVDEFDSFDKISGWLQNVAVLSRIELSRSLKLAGMKESVMDMSELVNRIQEQINNGEKETENFIKKTSVVYEEYKDYTNKETVFLKEFTTFFVENINEISIINNRFSEELNTFVFFTGKFYDLFDFSEGELVKLKQIETDLKTVQKDLKCIEDKLGPAVEENIGGRNIAEWKIKNDDMNRIIEKFTIYSHKKTAGEVSGLNVEDSVLEAGEITLF